ncbi:hypothetical protein FRZ03_28150 [Streptomyces misionensis]|uniref:UDP-glucose/GDP-mannose dehydrogenase C-terminal domain-containing protein n=1 Tax=Streptomyces misionensis TaxID=67331 RepID=A0A5C6J028_9ACTN|nr:hypothetical protein FRZ03_28150 [Streptomyces misionensis]
MAPDAGAGVEAHEPERLGRRRFHRLAQVQTGIAGHLRQFVDQRDVHSPEGVLQQLRESTQARGQGSRLIDLAAQINGARPAYVVNRLGQHLTSRGRSLDGARVLLLGPAYKPGSGDLRKSPALEAARLLAASGAKVSATDPFVDPAAASAALDGVRLVFATDDELAAADAVVLLTDHEVFDYDQVAARSTFVLDCRGHLAARLTAAATVEQL